MPYIVPSRRLDLAEDNFEDIKNAGELNFVFTTIALEYFKARKNYQAINDIIGALEGCKLEWYRRVAAPYEEIKIIENGDVY